MKRGGITFLWLLGIGALAFPVLAVVNDSSISESASGGQTPYSAIWLRNVFDLKPPPPPVSDTKTNTPPSNVKLTGITTIFGKAQALFLVQDAATPGKPPGKEESYILSVGDRQGGLEVLDINPKSSLVKIMHDGLESTITFDTNRPPSGGPAGQVSAPGAPPSAGEGVPLRRGPGGRSPGFPSGSPMPIARPMRSADGSYPQGQGGYSPVSAQGGYAPAYQGGNVQAASSAGTGLNLGSLFNQPQSTPQPQAAEPPTTTPEASAVQALVYQQVNAAGIRAGTIPPLPVLPGMPDPAAPGAENQSGSESGADASVPSLVPTIPTTRFYPPGYGPKSTGGYVPAGAQ